MLFYVCVRVAEPLQDAWFCLEMISSAAATISSLPAPYACASPTSHGTRSVLLSTVAVALRFHIFSTEAGVIVEETHVPPRPIERGEPLLGCAIDGSDSVAQPPLLGRNVPWMRGPRRPASARGGQNARAVVAGRALASPSSDRGSSPGTAASRANGRAKTVSPNLDACHRSS